MGKDEATGKEKSVPLCEKALLTLNEAAAYTGIGINKLREITNEPGNNLVVYIGSRRMIKRKRLEEFLDNADSL